MLKQLKAQDIDISLDGDHIRIKSNSEQLPSGLPELLKKNKQEIVTYLRHKLFQTAADNNILPAPEQPLYPASSAQQRLFFLQQLAKESTAYNLPMVLSLGTGHDHGRLLQAFRLLVQRHESLRTFFVLEAGELYQQVGSHHDFELETYHCSRDNFEAWLQAYVRPFSLLGQRLLRAALVNIEGGGNVLVVDIHHIITDGISQQLLINDFFRLYYGAALEPLRLQYKDFAVWQQQPAVAAIRQKQLHYWLNELSAELPKLDFPSDRTRPSIFTFKGATHRFIFDKTLTRQINDFNKQNKSTLQMTFLAALYVLYHRYTAQEDMIIGCGIAGRSHRDLEQVVGMFVNSLPIRSRPDPRSPFIELHSRVMANCIRAYDNQDVQFEEIVDALKEGRDTSRNPVFDVALMIQNFDHSTAHRQTEADTMERFAAHRNEAAKFDMAWFVTPQDDEIHIGLQYYAEIFDAATMERLAGHLRRVFEIVLANPLLQIGDIDLIAPGESEHILTELAYGPRLHYPENTTVPLLFDRQCSLTPQRSAVTDETGVYTYAQLRERADRLAAWLMNAGVGKESRVAILQGRDKDLVVSVLAVMKAGAAYVPLDSDQPLMRMQYMLDDTSPAVLLTDENHFAVAAELRANYALPLRLVNIRTEDFSNTPVTSSPLPEGTIHDLAYIMYTSGTTGKPKGVMVEHAGIARLVKPAGYVNLDGSETLLSTMAITFDLSVFEYWSMLLNGGHLVICTKEVLLDNKRLPAMMKKNGVNMMMLSTGLLNQLVDSNMDIFGGLRTLLSGGDKMSAKHVALLMAQYPSLEIINVYGPTEDTSIALTYTIDAVHDRIPIGRPIINTSVYILDNKGKPCPVGIAGEIYLGGPALARGYLNLPEQTAARFIAHPFVAGETLYRTGDFGKWLPDGNIDFLGRQDDQIKIRGFRVELGEIEAALPGFPGVEAGVVIAVRTKDGSYELKAFFTASSVVDITALRVYLRERLPFYMVPLYLLQVPQLPLNISGKVDKRKLMELDTGTGAASTDCIAPVTATQQQLLTIWQRLLNKDKISVEDNFFDVGGHSLKVMKMLSEINKTFAVDLELETVFTHPTIAFIAAEIDRVNWAVADMTTEQDTEHFVI